MQSVGEWLGRADWTQRTAAFDDLVAEYGLVTMAFAPPGAPVSCSEQVWQVWSTLPRHRNVLEAVGRGRVLYAPLDWTWRVDPKRLADVGVELARAYSFLTAWVPARQLAWLTAPLVSFDLDGGVRLAFVSVDREHVLTEAIPPEALEQWPHCTERGAVFTVGQVLRRFARTIEGPTLIDAIIERCTARDPAARYPHLSAVNEALRDAGGRARGGPLLVPPAPIAEQIEQGIGFLAVGDPERAYARFSAAYEQDPSSVRARVLREEARVRTARLTVEAPPELPDVTSAEVPVAIDVRLPQATAWAEAKLPARTFSLLPVGEPAPLAPPKKPRLRTLPRAMEVALGQRQHAEALRLCDEWLALAPDAVAVLYARGKALLGLRRLVEARAAFERVCQLEPQHLAAMLLRREADRLLAGVRATTGVDAPIRLAVPAHLGALSEMLVDGRIDDAIAQLEQPVYTDDAAARALHDALLEARAVLAVARRATAT